MNMNPPPDWSRPLRWHRARTDGNPLPTWARVLAVVLVFGGYGLLEWQDAATERGIARADARGEVIAEARPQ